MASDASKKDSRRYDQLHEEVQRKSTELKTALKSTSTLPFDTFQTSDPILESALVDSAVQIFLKHLTAPGVDLPDIDLDTLPKLEKIAPEELRETVETITNWEPTEPPEVEDRLDEERMWILADLTFHGHGLTKQRATAELRRFLDRIWADDIEIAVLNDLVEALRDSDPDHGGSALMLVLMRAASSSLQRQQKGPPQ